MVKQGEKVNVVSHCSDCGRFFAGLIARALHPGEDKAGFIVTTLLGIAGSLLATMAVAYLDYMVKTQRHGFIASVIGAIIILFIYNLVTKKS